MGKCIVCGKSTGLFSKDKICKKCKEYHVLKIKSCIEFINRVDKDIERGFKKLEPYISRYSKILEVVDQIDISNDILGNIYKTPAKDDVIKQMSDFLIEFNAKRIEAIYNYKRKETFITKLFDYQDEIEYCMENYDILQDTLNDMMNEVIKIQDANLGDSKSIETAYIGKEVVQLMTDEQYKKYNNDVLSFQSLLDEINNITPFELKAEDIIRKPLHQSTGRYNFSRLKENIKTPTGKEAKYPTELLFETNDEFNGEKDFFGKIFYTKDNEIGKAKFVFWNNHTSCAVYFKRVADKLIIAKVESNNEIIYKV